MIYGLWTMDYGLWTLSQLVALFEPSVGTCIGRHSPVASGTERTAADFWSVGQTAPLELLGKEAAAECLKPLANSRVVVLLAECLSSQQVYLCRTETPTQDVIEEEVV